MAIKGLHLAVSELEADLIRKGAELDNRSIKDFVYLACKEKIDLLEHSKRMMKMREDLMQAKIKQVERINITFDELKTGLEVELTSALKPQLEFEKNEVVKQGKKELSDFYTRIMSKMRGY